MFCIGVLVFWVVCGGGSFNILVLFVLWVFVVAFMLLWVYWCLCGVPVGEGVLDT